MPVLTNARHERFAQEVAKGLCADDAYRVAGYAPDRAHASRLAANGRVRSRIDEILGEGARQAGVTVEAVVRELAKIGFSDIRRVVGWESNLTEVAFDPETGKSVNRSFNNVSLIDSEKIDDNTAASISEISQSKEGSLKIKLHDKRAALVDLGRHLGMFKDKMELSGEVTSFSFLLDNASKDPL